MILILRKEPKEPSCFIRSCAYVYMLIHTFHNGTGARIALRYELDDRGFESRKGLGMFLFTTTSRPALMPIQPPIQWVQGALTTGVKWPFTSF